MVRLEDAIYISKYAHDNELLDKSGWKNFCISIKNIKKMNRLLGSFKAKQIRNTVKIKFGINIPCDHKEAMMFDADNGDTNWKNAELLELKQI